MEIPVGGDPWRRRSGQKGCLGSYLCCVSGIAGLFPEEEFNRRFAGDLTPVLDEETR